MRFRTYATLVFGSLFIVGFLFSSCKKEPEIIIETVTETVVQTDTITIIQLDSFTIVEIDSVLQTVHDTATTFIIVRHAETMGGGSNPVLSGEGEARAIELSNILNNVPLGAVYATNFNRTMQTAAPTASTQSLLVQTYEPFVLDPLVDDSLDDFHGGAVLVVGHSNTNASLLNLLTGTNDYPDFPEDVYNDLFVVSVYEKGRSDVVYLKYGD